MSVDLEALRHEWGADSMDDHCSHCGKAYWDIMDHLCKARISAALTEADNACVNGLNALATLSAALTAANARADAAEYSAAQDEEAAMHSGGILSNVCDLAFEDETRASYHAYDGIEDRVALIMRQRDEANARADKAERLHALHADHVHCRAQAESLKDERDAAVAMLRWHRTDRGGFCIVCVGHPHTGGCADGCELDALLR